jgi:RNA polymerase sigma factor (sigma-70 family)
VATVLHLGKGQRWQNCRDAMTGWANQHKAELEASVLQGFMVYTRGGRMHVEQKTPFDTGYQNSLGLRRREVSSARCGQVPKRGDGMTLENCPANGREWIEREKDGRNHEPVRFDRERFTRGDKSYSPPQSDATSASNLRAWSEEQLITAAKGGRRAPFGELCERHMKQVLRVAHRIVRNREDAEDAVQDCFLNAFVHLKGFDGRSQFGTWLTRIAINTALMKLRKNRWAREIPMDELNPSPDPTGQREFRHLAPDPEESCSLRERERILKSAISALRPRARNVVELIYLQEHSIRETAQILGISTATVKARMFHARVALHRMPALQIRSNRLSTGR